MKEGKRDNYRFWHSPLALGVFFIALVFFSYNIVGLLKKEVETSEKKDIVLDKKASLEKKAQDLEKNIARLDTDEGKEEVIREKYQVAKEGEKMVTITDENPKDIVETPEQKENHGFWNWIKGFFGK